MYSYNIRSVSYTITLCIDCKTYIKKKRKRITLLHKYVYLFKYLTLIDSFIDDDYYWWSELEVYVCIKSLYHNIFSLNIFVYVNNTMLKKRWREGKLYKYLMRDLIYLNYIPTTTYNNNVQNGFDVTFLNNKEHIM